MQRAKRIYILLGVLAAVCVVTFAVTRVQEKKEAIQASGETILTIDADTVTALSWENEDAALAFTRATPESADETEPWTYTEDEAFPVSDDAMNDLLEPLADLGAAFVIDEVEDTAQYGLDEPICTISLTADGTDYQILLGDYSKMDEQRYASIGDGKVYLLVHDPLDEFGAGLSDVIENDAVPDFDEVSELRVSGAETMTAAYAEDSADAVAEDDAYFVEYNGQTLPLATTRVNSYLKVLKKLDPTDYVTYKATEDDLAQYGLDDPELTVEIDYTDTNDDDTATSGTFTIAVSRDPDERAAAEAQATAEDAEAESDESTETEDVTAYIRIGDSPIVYQITGDQYEDLMAAGVSDLRHAELFTADFADVTQLDFTLDGVSYTLTSEGSGDDRTWTYNGEEIDIADVQDALEALAAEEADDFTDEAPAADAKQEISVTLTLDNENCPTQTIALYRQDGSTCLATSDGTPVAAVPRTEAIDLVEAVNAIVLQ